jgi:serine/threonine-protein kinase HipA
MPRHFVQTAAKAGIHQRVVPDIIQELRLQTPLAINTVWHALPTEFPQRLRDSITDGIQRRLQRLTAD